jgi:hypothetical protein
VCILNRPKQTYWWSQGYVKICSLTRGCQRGKSELRGGTISTFITNKINLTYATNGPEHNYPKSYPMVFFKFSRQYSRYPQNSFKVNFKIIASLRKYHENISRSQLSNEGISNHGSFMYTRGIKCKISITLYRPTCILFPHGCLNRHKKVDHGKYFGNIFEAMR